MSILREADEIVNGARQKDYGSPKVNFERTAKMWSAILGIEIEWHQVPACLIALKLARLVNEPMHEDSWRDIAGYAGTWDLGRKDGG